MHAAVLTKEYIARCATASPCSRLQQLCAMRRATGKLGRKFMEVDFIAPFEADLA
jgi:hypothetical protein